MTLENNHFQESGWLKKSKQCLSPNFNTRPNSQSINLLVIHSISLPPGIYGGSHIEDFFCNQLESSHHPYFTTIEDLKVSSHFLIKRNGELIQFVSVLDRAWHAGESSFQGEDNCNDFSIGVELEGLEGEVFEETQYKTLAKLTLLLQERFPKITQERICAHSDISPGRKNDPGDGFDWQHFFSLLT